MMRQTYIGLNLFLEMTRKRLCASGNKQSIVNTDAESSISFYCMVLLMSRTRHRAKVQFCAAVS